MGIRSVSIIAILCAMLVMPGATLAASFSDFTNGVKTLTGAAKDVNEIRKGDTQPAAEQQKKAPAAPTRQSKKQAAPQDDERMRGG